jgi:hypothetical protein
VAGCSTEASDFKADRYRPTCPGAAKGSSRSCEVPLPTDFIIQEFSFIVFFGPYIKAVKLRNLFVMLRSLGSSGKGSNIDTVKHALSC